VARFYWVIAITSSSTYAFNPGISDLILNAFARIQIRGPELTAQHLSDAGMEVNLLSVQFSNRNPMQYALETPTIPLVQGTATYPLPNRTLAIGLVYVTGYFGTPTAFDRPLGPLSASDYGAIPNKTIQGPPTSYHLQLLPVPTLTFWPTPDNSQAPYVANVQSFRQQQDVSLSGGQTIDAPYRFLDAFTAGLAARMARIYAPALYPLRKQDWEEAWQEVTQRDSADDAMYIVPGLASYYY